MTAGVREFDRSPLRFCSRVHSCRHGRARARRHHRVSRLSPTPDNHSVKGFGGGVGLLIVGFEFEYANLSEDDLEQLPGLKTYSGNVLVQTPIMPGTQLYGTVGAQGYQEKLGDCRRRTSAPTSAAARRSSCSDRFACGWTTGSSSCKARRSTTSTSAFTPART